MTPGSEQPGSDDALKLAVYEHTARTGAPPRPAWDALGIVAALRRPGEVLSRCEQTHEPLVLQVDEEGR